jgi:hypothetical protein
VTQPIEIDEIVVGDKPESWRNAGFTVDDDVCRLGHVRVRLIGHDEGRRIRRWSLRGIAAEGDLDGLVTLRSEAERCEPAKHANGCVGIDHVVLATPDTRRTTKALEDQGLESRRIRETETSGSAMLQTFFRAGEVILELVGPPEPSGDGPAGFFGLALTVDDLDATAALLSDDLGPVKDAVQHERRIATLRHRNVDVSVATAFMSRHPGT